MLNFKNSPHLEANEQKCTLTSAGHCFRMEYRLSERKMIDLWKKQFTVERLAVKHEDPSVFILSQWQRKPEPSVYYLVYRWTVAIFFLVSWILSILDLQHADQSSSFRVKWLIYLTNWGFTMCTVQTLLGAAMLSSCFLTARNRDIGSTAEGDNKALKLYKIYWVTNITATDIAFGITIIYWSLIYDETRMSMDAMNTIVHVVNSVLMLLDLCLVAHPVRILHVYWPVLFGVLYVVFSIFYYIAGGTSKEGFTYVYPILDWSKPGITILVCAAVTVFLIILHCCSYGIYRLRKFVYIRLIHTKEETKNETNNKAAYNNPVLSSDVV